MLTPVGTDIVGLRLVSTRGRLAALAGRGSTSGRGRLLNQRVRGIAGRTIRSGIEKREVR
jgi:hypothetical protein